MPAPTKRVKPVKTHVPQDSGITNIEQAEDLEISSEDDPENVRIVKHFGKDVEAIYEEGWMIMMNNRCFEN